MAEKVLHEVRIVETDDGYRIEIKGDKERLKEMGFGRMFGLGGQFGGQPGAPWGGHGPFGHGHGPFGHHGPRGGWWGGRRGGFGPWWAEEEADEKQKNDQTREA